MPHQARKNQGENYGKMLKTRTIKSNFNPLSAYIRKVSIMVILKISKCNDTLIIKYIISDSAIDQIILYFFKRCHHYIIFSSEATL